VEDDEPLPDEDDPVSKHFFWCTFSWLGSVTNTGSHC